MSTEYLLYSVEPVAMNSSTTHLGLSVRVLLDPVLIHTHPVDRTLPMIMNNALT